MLISYLQKLFQKYERLVKSVHTDNFAGKHNDVNDWKDRLFTQFLLYCFPVSFIAAVPGIYMSFKTGFPVIGFIDIFCLLLLSVSTFANNLKLRVRKLLVIFLFYILAIFLVANLGYIGPGIFYLFAITILIALIFPPGFGYISVAVNGLILLCFALVIYLKPFNSALEKEYSASQWLAFSSNLIFLSIVLVVLIHKIFNGLQSSILKKDALKLKYKSIFENSPLPMWLFDIESLAFLDVNEAAVIHYGYTKAEFLKLTIKDIRPPQYIRGIEQVVECHKNDQKFLNNNIIHIKRNGEKINVKIESSLMEFNGRKAKLVLATDITSQVKAQDEIQISNAKVKQSESNLRAIFDNTNEGFVLLDLHSNIITYNAKAKESVIFNMAKVEFEVGKSIFEFVEDRRRENFEELVKRVLNGELIEYDRELFINNNIRWIHFTLNPVIEGGVIAGTCITGRDITEHKKYVQTIEKQIKTFREISWMQSHLVRAPLARIMGLTTLLSAETNEQEKAEIIRLLKISSTELDDIIKEITQKTAINKKAHNLSESGQ